MNRRTFLQATTGAAVAGPVLAGRASGYPGEDRSIIEIRFWVHESVAEALDAETWRTEYEPDLEEALAMVDRLFDTYADVFDIDITYTWIHADLDTPTTGDYRNGDGEITADTLRDLLPYWADRDPYVNCHLIWDEDTSDETSLGHSRDRAYVDGTSGECYVNLGFYGSAPLYLFPNLYVHEVVHCLANRGGTDEHAGGTPQWEGESGAPTVMATGYANAGANALGGSQVPEEDCYGNSWSSGTTLFTPDPVPILTECTLRNVEAFFTGERTVDGAYDLEAGREVGEL